MTRSIPDLLDEMASSEIATAAPACRLLLQRHGECLEHAESIARFLHDDNAAIADTAYRTLERIGQPALFALLQGLPNATGAARSHYLSLIAQHCDDATLNDIFTLELDSDEDHRRFHAANCVGRRLAGLAEIDSSVGSLLDRAIAVLETSRNGKLHSVYWPQSRMTLRGLGLLDSGGG